MQDRAVMLELLFGVDRFEQELYLSRPTNAPNCTQSLWQCYRNRDLSKKVGCKEVAGLGAPEAPSTLRTLDQPRNP